MNKNTMTIGDKVSEFKKRMKIQKKLKKQGKDAEKYWRYDIDDLLNMCNILILFIDDNMKLGDEDEKKIQEYKKKYQEIRNRHEIKKDQYKSIMDNYDR